MLLDWGISCIITNYFIIITKMYTKHTCSYKKIINVQYYRYKFNIKLRFIINK